jgi:sarcosine oxidase subunit beta
MSERCEVLVIGGGIMGAATAFEVASRGVDTILVDRGKFGHGDTAKTAGIIRTNYSNPEVVRMALRGREIFASFSQHVGGPNVFTQAGYIFLVPEHAVERATQNAALQRAEGALVEEIDAEAVSDYLPGALSDGIAVAFHEPRSGYAEPQSVVDGYVSAARAAGARTWDHLEATRILTEEGRVSGAATARGDILAGTVVIAGGALSSKLALTCGVTVPMDYSLEEELIVAADPATAPIMAVSDMVEATYLRPFPLAKAPEGTVGTLLGRGFPKDYDPVEPDKMPAAGAPKFEADLRERICRRQPGLRDAPVIESRVAVYDITPDWHPIVGPTDRLPGLVFATGGSGHGYKLGPAIGEMVAGSIVGDLVPYASMKAFSLDRFDRGDVFRAAYGGNRA